MPCTYSLCINCGRKGHWKKACRSKTVSQVTAELEDTAQQVDESFFLGEVIEAIHSDERHSQPWKAEVLVNNIRVNFMLDSGADVTVIPLLSPCYDAYILQEEPTSKRVRSIIMIPS